ncbi:MAG: helix-turn-helix transcriptional regulator, partial [Eggerthellaceae bacterium]
MAIQDTLIALREQHGLTQSELAERLFVTRQAVSRWECGETQPG